MRHTVIHLHELWEVLWPLGLLFWGSKQIMQQAIESLALRVATGVVWSGPGLLDPIERTMELLRPHVYWPTMYREVRDYISRAVN